MKNIDEKLNNLKKFDKSERSSFPYWFWHCLAYNVVAWNLGVWKFKYIFHDWYKPWLRLFMPYKKVQEFHRKHSNHHIEWLEYKLSKIPRDKRWFVFSKLLFNFDYEGAIIDWECSRFTKNAAQLTAYDKYKELFQKNNFKNKFPELYHDCYEDFSYRIYHTIEYLGLVEENY